MISIIICTCNRAEHLQGTLESLKQLVVPSGMECELIVVDNGSSDNTREVIEAAQLPQMPVRSVCEPKRGQCRARNRGIAEAQGEILLWTDDDVRPPANWIEGMCEPILAGRGQAVAGGVKMAPDLERPWMKAIHRAAVAETGRLNPELVEDMVGANMAFSREVLARVPAFDPELGPGAMGFWDDTLFSYQLKKAGFVIASALDVAVEHHFDASRLSRKSLLNTAEKLGQSEGYLFHHWFHFDATTMPKKDLIRAKLRLLYWHLKRGRECHGEEGCPEWEFVQIRTIAALEQFFLEAKRPVNYEKFGLVKRVAAAQVPA